MTKRAHKLARLKIAGHHDDSRAWMREYIGGRVSMTVAKAAWAEGQKARAAGVACSCGECAAG